MNWQSEPIAAFDLETTGPDPAADFPIQYGWAYQAPGGRVLSSEKWCNPGTGKPLTRDLIEAIKLTAAEIEAIEAAPSSAALVERTGRMFTQVQTVVGWNCGNRLGDPFDLQILERDAKRHGIALTDLPMIDVMPFACQLLPICPEMPNRQLPTVAAFFGLDTSRAHRAGGDCSTTVQVLDRLATRLPADYGDLLALSIRWSRLSWWLLDAAGSDDVSPADRYRVNCGKWYGWTLGGMAMDRDYRGGREYLQGWMWDKSGPAVRSILSEVLQ